MFIQDNSDKCLQLESIAQKFLNRLVSEENDKFEVYGIYRVKDSFSESHREHNEKTIKYAMEKYVNDRKSHIHNQIHIIWTDDYWGPISSLFIKMLKKHDLDSVVFTFITMFRLGCITKEDCENHHQE